MNKVRIVRKVRLVPARGRLRAIEQAAFDTSPLRSREIFLEVLTIAA
jgi:tryptophanase